MCMYVFTASIDKVINNICVTSNKRQAGVSDRMGRRWSRARARARAVSTQVEQNGRGIDPGGGSLYREAPHAPTVVHHASKLPENKCLLHFYLHTSSSIDCFFKFQNLVIRR